MSSIEIVNLIIKFLTSIQIICYIFYIVVEILINVEKPDEKERLLSSLLFSILMILSSIIILSNIEDYIIIAFFGILSLITIFLYKNIKKIHKKFDILICIDMILISVSYILKMI